ncbi:hypothetical protein Pmani_023082 [Petrolisthes manimaculis]|uniref:Protein kinase domain-containing protein n=1 Tax=Petrolisthes manimaculis TaxID=1843537 RepID=A0AAE1NVG1_9EUCA|nr:hypothetical protein Pmani_031378 [Petrolisthes manimaculis]KAK4304999.1 hypothetical protein Pmani_023082 [Petrolisthes manimaculis]
MLLMRSLQQVVNIVSKFHARSLIHNDIKSNNILLSLMYEAPWVRSTVIDLGAVTVKGAQPYEGKRFRSKDYPYLSPELVTGGQVTTASDVYSLGWLLKEVLLRFPILSPIRKKMIGDVMRCLDHNPNLRPSITNLQTLLAKINDITELVNARRIENF